MQIFAIAVGAYIPAIVLFFLLKKSRVDIQKLKADVASHHEYNEAMHFNTSQCLYHLEAERKKTQDANVSA
jgi:hypothetical protein